MNLNKRMKITATASVSPGIGAQTVKAIHGNEGFHHPASIDEAWDRPFPSSWYTTPSDKLTIGGFQAVNLPFRIDSPAITNDVISLTNTAQVGGTHYGNPATDVYAFSMANNLDAMQFNVVKYVTRFRKKDGIKDLRKAMQTLERLIAFEEARK